MTIYKVALPIEGETQLFHCRAIEFEGRIWLAPLWTPTPDGKHTKPDHIILLEQFPHQKIDPPSPFGEDFVVNIPVPKALFESPIQQKLKARFVVIEQPDITFRLEPVH
jgi:hypothetical protein